jgi:hypothetical protein
MLFWAPRWHWREGTMNVQTQADYQELSEKDKLWWRHYVNQVSNYDLIAKQNYQAATVRPRWASTKGHHNLGTSDCSCPILTTTLHPIQNKTFPHWTPGQGPPEEFLGHWKLFERFKWSQGWFNWVKETLMAQQQFITSIILPSLGSLSGTRYVSWHSYQQYH